MPCPLHHRSGLFVLNKAVTGLAVEGQHRAVANSGSRLAIMWHHLGDESEAREIANMSESALRHVRSKRAEGCVASMRQVLSA